MSESILYYSKKEEWKYYTQKERTIKLPHNIKFSKNLPEIIEIRFLTINTKKRNLKIHKGFRWDGPSGIAIDTKSFMFASLIHDILYRLQQERIIPLKENDDIDNLMYKLCRINGMWAFRAKYCTWAVKRWGKKHRDPKNFILKAPGKFI